MQEVLAGGKDAWQDAVESWNRFWFSPRRPYSVSVLRIIAGIAAIVFFLNWSQDLVAWFGADGLFPVGLRNDLTAARITAINMGPRPAIRVSPIDFLNQPALLYAFHALAILFSIAMTVGFFSRIATVGVFFMVLSYVTRGPQIAGLLEPVLLMVLLYLCLAPSGGFLSVDRLLKLDRFLTWRKNREPGSPSISANIALRLIQLHLLGFYLVCGLWKLAGGFWWDGSAMWWIAAHSESRLIDFTGMASMYFLFNLWTHAVVIFELSFPVLIWRRDVRFPLLVIAVGMWGMLGLVTGQLAWCLFMTAASFAFYSFANDEPKAETANP